MRLLAKKYYQNLGEKWKSHRFLRDISDHIRYLGYAGLNEKKLPVNMEIAEFYESIVSDVANCKLRSFDTEFISSGYLL